MVKRKWLVGTAIVMGLFYMKIDYLQIKSEQDKIYPTEYAVIQYIPYLHYGMTQETGQAVHPLAVDILASHVPFLKYGKNKATQKEDTACEQVIAWNDKQEWKDSYADAFEAENSVLREKAESLEEKETAEEKDESALILQEAVPADSNQLFTVLEQHTIQRTFSKQNIQNVETLQKRFFTIDPATAVRPGQLELQKLLETDVHIEKSDAPQILIYHTHSQEAFVDSIPGDVSTGIVGAGEFLAGILSEKYGYRVIHHCGMYDVESRDYAYARAAPALEAILKEYPSIEVVIDLHRDAVPENTKLVTNLNGIDVAQFMLFDGLSYTRERGEITYLQNPYIQSNLALAFQMKLTADCYYPELARKIYLKGYRYNMQYCPKSLLIELGAQTNTVQEIMNACFPLAHTIDTVLSGNTPSLTE